MKANRELGKRIESVLFAYMSQIGSRVTLADFGKAVAKAEGRAHPYTAATVNGWFQGISEPRLSVFRALAKLSGQHPSVIAFGEETPNSTGGDTDFAQTWKRGNTVRSKP